jgi:hypothetical protein
MKITRVLFLFCLLALATANPLDNFKTFVVKKVELKEYLWGLDIFRIILDYAITLVTLPVFLIPSLFINNQEWAIIYLYAFLNAPVFRLSGWNK